jgi:hypothetical protein
MRLTASRLGDHLPARQEPQLDAHAREADPGSARLGAGREVVVASEIAAWHPGSIVGNGQRGARRISAEDDAPRPRVERIGDDLGEDRLLDAARVGVAQVFEKTLQVDASFAHGSSDEDA